MQLPSTVNIVYGYLKHTESVHRQSTAKMYEWHMITYLKYLKCTQKSLHESTVDDLTAYLNSKTEWDAVTKNHAMTILKSFYKYYINKIPAGISNKELRFRLTRESQIREILTLNQYKKKSSRKNKALSIEEVKKLLEHSKNHNYLDYAIIWIFLWTGMRKGEFLVLSSVKNVFWHENRIHLFIEQTKNYTERDIYLDDYSKNMLRYIYECVGYVDKITDFNQTYLNKMFSKYDDVLNRHLFPHMMRHTFITQMSISIHGNYKGNEDILIKTLSGHNIKNSDMTACYTNIDETTLRETILKYHYLMAFEK